MLIYNQGGLVYELPVMDFTSILIGDFGFRVANADPIGDSF